MRLRPIGLRAHLLRVSFYSLSIALVSTRGAAQALLPQAPQELARQTPPMAEEQFTRYTMPAACAGARQWWEDGYWRARQTDTVFYTALGLPYEPQTVAAVKNCAARFTALSVAGHDLLGLAHSALVAGEFVQAEAALRRLTQLVAKKSVAERALVDWEVVTLYLDPALLGLPKTVAALGQAEVYTTKLDALGNEAAPERMLAHTALAVEAQWRDSVPLWDRETRLAVAAAEAIQGDARHDYAYNMLDAYMALANFRERQNDVAGAKAILATARTLLIPLRPHDVYGNLASWLDHADAYAATQGTTPGPIPATRWAPASAANQPYPTPGKPALVVFASINCGDGCYESYGVVRRLMALFPPGSLDLILVTHTEGFMHTHKVSPDTEMAGTQDYFLSFLHLPAMVAMWNGTYTMRPDSVYILQPPAAEQLYHPPLDTHYPYLPVQVIDKHGVIRLVAPLAHQDEMLLRDVVKTVL